MTDQRYEWWKNEISKARADNNSAKLNVLQLDYNLELGECLAHQSQRTKDIKKDLTSISSDLVILGGTVTTLSAKVSDALSDYSHTCDTVDNIDNIVRKLDEKDHDNMVRRQGAITLLTVLKYTAITVATVSGWLYSLYHIFK